MSNCIKTEEKYVPGTQPLINKDLEGSLKNMLISNKLKSIGLFDKIDYKNVHKFISNMLNQQPSTGLKILYDENFNNLLSNEQIRIIEELLKAEDETQIFNNDNKFNGLIT